MLDFFWFYQKLVHPLRASEIELAVLLPFHIISVKGSKIHETGLIHAHSERTDLGQCHRTHYDYKWS